MQKNTQIKLKNNPSRTGHLTGEIRSRKGSIYWQIKFTDGSIDYVGENEIEEVVESDFDDHYSLLKKGEYGRASDLRQHLTFVHLSGRLANLVYSMGVTNTDFWPHQYKPLLALLDSPANGLLIADEVGLGKTIEAGLIWTELRVRYDMRRLLVICPAMLKEKWKDELSNRFGIKAKIVKAKELYDDLQDEGATRNNTDEAWIASYQSLRPPKDWKSKNEDINKSKNTRKLCDFLESNSEDTKLFDAVIFDEAHYMRNDSSAAHKLGNIIRDVSEFILLLSATPINLKSLDLFELLKLADPEHFKNTYDFEEMLASNKPLIKARDIVLDSRSDKKDILDILKESQKTQLLKFSSQLKALINELSMYKESISKEYRAEIAETIERINLLGHVVTRTRKRDIQAKRPVRRVNREAITMSEIEMELYSSVTDSIRSYAQENDIVTGFLLATYQRQISSCPAATFGNWEKRNFEDTENIDDAEDEIDKAPLRHHIYNHLNTSISYKGLYDNDSKFNRLKDLLLKFNDENKEKKIIIFTSFRATAKYLKERLSKLDIQSMLLWGSMDKPKQEYINQFKESKSLRVLISTEVASEGVDLQFSNFLINYDLPWNPMRVEQRIGRIDRLGQESDELFIWNLFYKDSIDERIIIRLMDRLNIFEEALGESEAVIGEQISKLESDLLIKPLTREEEDLRIAQTAQAIENLKQVQLNLEKNASKILSHGGLLIEKIKAAEEFSKRITDEDLIVYVSDFLVGHAQGFIFKSDIDNSNIFEVKLPSKIAAELFDFIRVNQLFGMTTLANGSLRKCHFKNKVGHENKHVEIINQFHPLIRYISDKYIRSKKKFYPLVAIELKNTELNIKKGFYVFCVKRSSFQGLRSEEHLDSIAIRLDNREILTSEKSDQLINSSRLNGGNFLDISKIVNSDDIGKLIDTLELNLDESFEKMRLKKANENKDRIAFQKNSLEQHKNRKLPGLKEMHEKLLGENKLNGARLTKSRIDKLIEKTEVQLQKIMLSSDIKATKSFVCSGVINLK
ncbi:DEAD/DEAH box helicase [Methylophilaceae bacterium]|nr:DEAD/DEAH box helicase [Methylophilaceae bacterium]